MSHPLYNDVHKWKVGERVQTVRITEDEYPAQVRGTIKEITYLSANILLTIESEHETFTCSYVNVHRLNALELMAEL